jgi:hypothetical protein
MRFANRLLFSYQVEASNITGLFNTGVDNSGNVLGNDQIDNHYSLVTNPAYTIAAVGNAIAVNSSFGYPLTSPWVGDNSTSEWLIPQTNTQGAGFFDYHTTFNLIGSNPNSAQIIGQWSTDNPGIDILLNGQSLNIQNNNQFTSWTPFTINKDFVSGVNTLDFIVRNDGGPTGLRVEMSSAVPEAGEWAMMLLGLPLLGWVVRRKQAAMQIVTA